MLYAIVSQDVDNSLPLRKQLRAGHLARLQELNDQGRLVLAGRNPAIDAKDAGDAGFTGSLVVAEFDNLAQAQAWADADPYLDGGVYASVMVKPFDKVLP